MKRDKLIVDERERLALEMNLPARHRQDGRI